MPIQVPSTKYQVPKKLVSFAGFTLVELLVAIGLMVMVTAVAIPSLRNFNKDQQLTETASKIADILKNAQSSSNSGIQCPAGEVAEYWSVVIGTSNYNLISRCLTSQSNKTIFTSSYSSTPTDPTTFAVTTNVCTNEATTLFFRPFGVTYKCASGVNEVTGEVRITVPNSGNTFSKVIVVETGGVIRVE